MLNFSCLLAICFSTNSLFSLSFCKWNICFSLNKFLELFMTYNLNLLFDLYIASISPQLICASTLFVMFNKPKTEKRKLQKTEALT